MPQTIINTMLIGSNNKLSFNCKYVRHPITAHKMIMAKIEKIFSINILLHLNFVFVARV